MRQKVVVYLRDYHYKPGSAFYELVGNPLGHLLDIEYRLVDEYNPAEVSTPVVFCQRLPKRLPPASDYPIAWIPMLDNWALHTQEKWQALPSYLRIVGFSEHFRGLATATGKPYISLKYYVNPASFQPVDWNTEPTLLYWNRVLLIDNRRLEKLCQKLGVKRLLFRADVDELLHMKLDYMPEFQDKSIKVEIIQKIKSKEAHLQQMLRANLMLAPRSLEGVGLTMLEALASKAVVIGLNAATMNEYIQHRQTGLLIDCHDPESVRQLRLGQYYRHEKIKSYPIIGKKLAALMKQEAPSYIDDAAIDDLDVRGIDYSQIGQNAYEEHVRGYQAWQQRLDEYAAFLV